MNPSSFSTLTLSESGSLGEAAFLGMRSETSDSFAKTALMGIRNEKRLMLSRSGKKSKAKLVSTFGTERLTVLAERRTHELEIQRC